LSPGEPPPRIDFERELAFASCCQGAFNHLEANFVLEGGDLRGGFRATEMAGHGFRWQVVVFPRAGVRSVHGRPIE
jgi:hypothetical protein